MFYNLIHRFTATLNKSTAMFRKMLRFVVEHVCEYKENFTAGGRAKFILVSEYGGTMCTEI